MKRRKVWITIFLLMVLIVVVPMKTMAAKNKYILNDKTGIPDQVLYQQILIELNKNPNDKFTEKEAKKITRLVAENDNKKNKIKTLKGIEYLKNLTYLDVSSNNLTSIVYIKKLQKLKYLNVSSNNLSDLLGIQKLIKVEHLDISLNKLSSLTGIEKLTNLIRLDAYYNQIKNISSISNLFNLRHIDLDNNKITSLKVIEKLPNLESMHVAGNRLKKLPDLKNYRNLREVNFKYNKLSNDELEKKLPIGLSGNDVWYKSQVKLQNLVKAINLVRPASFSKININTKKISGIANKNSTVSLRDPKGKKIVSVKTDSKGKFTFKKLNLKKWAGMTLSLQSYVVDQLYGEKKILKEVKFTIPK